jgi:uncharacterized protein YndB with AHSA1/START domain
VSGSDQDQFEVEIQAPPAKVWAVLMDVERWPGWTSTVTSVQRLEPAPLTLGSRTQLIQPKLKPAVWQVTELDETAGRFSWAMRSPGIAVTAWHRLESASSGSRMTHGLRFEGWLAPLLSRVLRKQNREYLELEAEGLKKRCEE